MSNKSFFILVIESDKTIRELISKQLLELGYSVDSISNNEEALNKFKAEEILPHLIFFELSSDENNNFQFIDEVKKLNEDVEVITIASYKNFDLAVDSVRRGAYDFIDKDSLNNSKLTEVITSRAIEKITLKYKYIHVVNKMKEQKDVNTKEAKDIEKKGIELQRKSTQLQALNNVVMKSQMEAEQRLVLSNTLYSLIEPNVVLQTACDLLSTFSDELSYVILLFDSNTNTLNTILSSMLDVPESINTKIDLTSEVTDSDSLKFFLDTIESYIEMETIIKEIFKTDNYVCETMLLRNKNPIGTFVIVGRERTNLARLPEFDEVLTLITRAYESALMHQKINEMAIKDGLTDLYNHKHFTEELDKEVRKSIRYNYPLSLLFFDIDDFKKFNDQNGHQVGDDVLKKLSDIIKDNTRDLDIVSINPKNEASDNSGNGKSVMFASRYGGEEFAIILPHTDLKGAYIVGERLRETIEKADFPCQEKQPMGTLTISMGIAESSEKVNSAKLTILVADAALYRAKKDGKNIVNVADRDLIEEVVYKGKLEL